MIHVIANIELFLNKKNDYLEKLKKVVPLVRDEPGCLAYGPAVDFQTDIPIQEPPHDNIITIIEAWSEIKALKAHLETDHMKAVRMNLDIDAQVFIKDPQKLLKLKEKEMSKAVKELDFETAAILRDEIAMLRDQLLK